MAKGICIYCLSPATALCPECGLPSVCEKHLKEYDAQHGGDCWEYNPDEFEDVPTTQGEDL